MSLSKEYQEYHLTPKGWVTGTFKADTLGASENFLTPEDSVVSLRCHDEQSSGHSKPYLYDEKIWESDDKDLVKKLKEKYGDKPNWFGYKQMK